jgi:catechol 2,3-dioxygenase-like lactoylglutathione lyase family enzyme
MGIRAVSHFAIGVRDMDRVVPFYRDLLGMRVAVDSEENFDDPVTGTRIERRSVKLRWADGVDTQFVGLDQNFSPPAKGEPTELWQIGIHHLALWVDDIDPYIAKVESVGGRALSSGKGESGGPGYAEPPGSRIRSVFLCDPEGNIVQLDQRLTSSW